MSETEPTGADQQHLRLPRRRRSVALTPALLEPAQLADDAAGRVEIIAIRAPADVLEPADAVAEPAPPPVESRTLTLLLSEDGWIAIGVLAAILVVLFLIGLRFTH